MNKEFRLPDVGEGLTEADIVSWHVKPGDTVTINQIIVDIETAKAVVELPSPYAGTVTALLVEEGQTVDVGTPIIAVDVPGAGDASPDARAAGRAGKAGTAGAAAGPRRLRRQAGIDEPPAAEAAADPAGLLPRHAFRPPDRRAARRQPLSRAGRSCLPGRDQASARHSAASRRGANGAGTRPARAKAPTEALAKPPVRRLARDLGVDAGRTGGQRA